MREPKNSRTSKTKRAEDAVETAQAMLDRRAARAKPGALSRYLDRAALHDGLKKFRGRLPADFKFDRDKANER